MTVANKKRIIRTTINNLVIGDIGITLRTIGDSIDLLVVRTFEQISNSRELKTALENGWIELYNENGTLISDLTDSTEALENASVYDAKLGDNSVWIPAGSFISSQTNGATIISDEFETNDLNLDEALFDNVTQQYIEFNLVMPFNWTSGIINAKFYWMPSASYSGSGVVWNIAAASKGNGDTIDTATGTSQKIADSANNITSLHITDLTPDVTISNSPSTGDLINFKVSRVVEDDNDDLNVPVILFGVLIKF